MSSIDNAVDPSTGTTAVKATFANRSQHLVPGAYVKGSLQLERLLQVVFIPQVAIQSGQKGPFVYVAQGTKANGNGPKGNEAQGKGAQGNGAQGMVAMPRQLQLGPASGYQGVVSAGLRPGEMVVVKGQFALSPGAAIRLPKQQAGNGSK